MCEICSQHFFWLPSPFFANFFASHKKFYARFLRKHFCAKVGKKCLASYNYMFAECENNYFHTKIHFFIIFVPNFAVYRENQLYFLPQS